MIEEECDNYSGSDEFFVDDPALDFLIYKKMTQNEKQRNNCGCFGLFIFIVIIAFTPILANFL